MILAVSRFRVANGVEEAVKQAFLARPHLVDRAPGFLGMETFTDSRDGSLFYLVTRWTDAESFRAWHASEAHTLSHTLIPRGLKLDPTYTRIVVLDRLAAADRPPLLEETVADSAPLLGHFLSATRSVHYLVAARDGTIRACNEVLAGLLGVPAPELVGTKVWDHLTAPDAEALARRVKEDGRDPQARFLLNVCDRDGHPHTLECQLDVQPDGLILLGEAVQDRERALQAELLRLNAEWAVLARDRAQLHARERAARAEVEAAWKGLAFLADASIRLAALSDTDTVLATVARLGISSLADWCVVDLLEPTGSFRAVAVAHKDPAKERILRELSRYPPDPDGPHPVAGVLRTHQSEVIRVIPDGWLEAVARRPEHRALLRAVGITSCMVVPMPVRGTLVGTMTFAAAESGRKYGPADLALAEDLVRRAGLAVDNARLYQDAQEAIRVREAFLARASHELRTPLTSALGAVRLLRRVLVGHLKEAPEALVDIADRSLESMLGLINDLLDASKLAAGREQLARASIDVAEVVGRSLAVIGVQARDKGVEVRSAVPAGLMVLADQQRLDQVLINLLANAVKFTPAGGEVTVEAEGRGAEVVVRVRDTGEGIPPADLERVFEAFVQAGPPGDRRRRGTGLGLAICRQIVGLHGGRIWAESEGPGRGSTFFVQLPRGEARTHAA